MKYNVLDNTGRAMCTQFSALKDDFYLAGGTGLALQIGHRMSDDFDFFTNQRFDNTLLLSKVAEIFPNDQIGQLQNEKQTLTLMIRGVKVSFFYVEPIPVTPLLETEYFRIASVREIGVFKLIALFRAAFKDYVDLHCILQQCPLSELLALARKKYPGMDEALYLKALLSFDDVDLSPIQYMEGYETTPEVIFESLQHHVDHYLKESMRKA
jgi:Nucleotidyl transferase AbiEii toxin, Type IV TA system